MRPARFGAGFALMSIMSWVLYSALFCFQVGARTAAEYWLYDALTVKRHLLRAMADKRKVLLVGGSSVWFGLDAGQVQQELGIDTLNLGLHAMHPLDRLVSDVRTDVKSGDIIIMQLEYDYYTIDTPHNDWYVNQVMAGDPEIFWELNWREKVEFFLSVPPLRVLEGVGTRVIDVSPAEHQKRIPRQPPEQVLLLMQQVWAAHALPEGNYTIRNIDPQGNAVIAKGTFTSYGYPFNGQSVARVYPWNTLGEFARYCADHGVLLYIGWPPVVKGSMAFDSPRIQEKVRTIEEKLAEFKIPVLGQAGDFQYDRRLFADTGYHLTHEGRALHTKHLLERLRAKMPVPNLSS